MPTYEGKAVRDAVLTHLDELWWPDEGIRKRHAIQYYAAPAPGVFPHLRDRPFTVKH